MMVSPAPRPQLARHRAQKSFVHDGGESSILATGTTRMLSSMATSTSRKRSRNESPTRDWSDLASSYDSLPGSSGPSPGFFNNNNNNNNNDASFLESRYDASRSYFSPSMVGSSLSSPAFISPNLASPSPLAQSRYQLAGGQATPTLTHSAISDVSSMSAGRVGESTSDLGFRRGRPYYDEKNHSVSAFSATQSSEERLPTALSRECNGRPRALPSVDDLGQSRLSWSVLQTITGVAGKVWDFCTAGTFRGFFAGGGMGYSMEFSHGDEVDPQLPCAKSIWQDMNSSAHLPGGFPDTDYIANYMESPSAHASKRVKHAHFEDDQGLGRGGSLTQSWIMVRDTSAASTPRRAASTAVASSASPASMRQVLDRPQLRRSCAGAPSSISRSSPVTRTASAAGLRSPTRSPLHSRQNSQIGSKGRHKRDSIVVNTQGEAETKETDSPLAMETAKFVKDMKKKERREDRDIYRMNRALEDMIREGREALGATVEVDMFDPGSDEEL